MIALIDYGAGNLFSVANGLDAIGSKYRLVREPSDLRNDDQILLPGVGHFGQMMNSLIKMGLKEVLIEAAQEGRPILGICLGMQAFFEWSDEAPGVPGLGLLSGTVQSLPTGCRVPHMGWNLVEFLDGESNWFYFANSFVSPLSEATWGTTDYFGQFSSAVRKNNISGFQFHPEKSGEAGLALIAKWSQNAG